ncbi:unnamed protein product [Sphagnum compactum]
MPQYDDPALTPAERDTGMTTNESDMNLDTNSEEYTGGSGKKTSLFGKLKDKTKNKVSQIKSKVGKKKSGGTPSDGSIESDSPAESHENDDERDPDEDEGEEEETSTDLPTGAEDAPPAPTTPSNTEPTTAPDSTIESTPQNVDDFGSGQPEPKPEAETPPESTPRSLEPEEKLSGTDTTATEDPAAPSSGQSETSGYPESDEPPKAGGGDKFEDVNAENQDSSAAQQPQDAALDQDSSGATPAENQSYTDKAARGAQGLRDAAYGTAGAAAGALGYDKLTESGKTDQDTNTPQDDTPGVQEKAQDLGQQAFHGASDAANTVGDKANEGVTQAQESSPDVPASATEAGNQAKDAVAGKSDQLNNATGDSQTYTDKAVETAAAVTGAAAATVGLDKASDGTSVADKTKGYVNSAIDNTKGYAQAATDKSKESGITQGTTGSVIDSTKDKIASATGAVQDAAQSTYDSSKDYVQSATDTSKDYASRTADQAAAARDTAVDKVTPKDEHKALADKVTDTISNLPAQVKDSVTGAVQGVTSPSGAQDDPHKEAGLLGRFTDLLFGKKPENATETTGETTAAVEGQ